MDAVVLQQVCEGLYVGQIVDGDDLEVGAADQLTEGQTADAAKSVDSNVSFISVCCVLFVGAVFPLL